MKVVWLFTTGVTRIWLLLIPVFLASCGGGGSSGDKNTSSNSNGVTSQGQLVISGSVGDGPIVGATLNIFDANGNLVHTGVSDVNARYTVRIQLEANAYPLTIEAQGGIDLVTGRAPDFAMLSVVADASAERVNINPFTTLIVKTARAMAGNLNEQAIATSRAIVMEKMNFGLDPALIVDPIGTPLTAMNVALMVKASETLGEMVRRSRDQLVSSGIVSDGDGVIDAIADDLVDGVMDGLGNSLASKRVAMVSALVSAQVLVEAMSNNLKVDGKNVTNALDSAIVSLHPEVSGPEMTGSVRINREALIQATVALDAARALAPSLQLTALANILGAIQAGSLPSTIELLLPGDSGQGLDQVIALASVANDAQIDSGNIVVNSGNSAPVNSPPVLSGTPATIISENSSYLFKPVANDADGDTLGFTIQNRPGWASFNSSTGQLSGTPASTDVGIYNNIVISVTDGQVSVALNAFNLTVNGIAHQTGPVSLSWTAPVARADGSALAMSEIAGYTIYYGSEAGNYTQSVDITDVSAGTATITQLPVGTYYFVLTTRDTDGRESGYSKMVVKVVQ